jgi:riboflavin synthase
MFTGLVESLGRIQRLTHRGNYLLLTIASEKADFDLQDGDSICCDGVCLTVVSCSAVGFTVEASQETTLRTTIGTWQVGRRLHLERALRADSRLGGHFVAGHVDCVGTIDSLKPVGESRELAVRYEDQYDCLVVAKGSVAVNGVSLTVNEVGVGRLSVNLIPYTLEATTLGSLVPGEHVNIEFDILGKYAVKQRLQPAQPGLTMAKLLESGW